MKIFASLGLAAFLVWLAVIVAVFCTYVTGVITGFHHGIIMGLVSLLPPVGFIEGILHFFGVV